MEEPILTIDEVIQTIQKSFLETKDENAKAMYEKNAEKLKQLMEQLTPYLLR
jgi:ABC-type Zn uptake system ZnuABC Zn-binding protein ZnuA